MSLDTDWYKKHVLKELENASREWLKKKIDEANSIKRCETTIK